MDAELKEKWVAALHSGDYRQGTLQLARQEGDGVYAFCCLGVLCDIAGLEYTVHESNDLVLGTYRRYKFEGGTDPATLPLTFREKVGIPTNEVDELIAMNDDRKASFDEIADYIEENL